MQNVVASDPSKYRSISDSNGEGAFESLFSDIANGLKSEKTVLDDTNDRVLGNPTPIKIEQKEKIKMIRVGSTEYLPGNSIFDEIINKMTPSSDGNYYLQITDLSASARGIFATENEITLVY